MSERAKRIAAEALLANGDRRDELLAQQCGDDDALRAEVESIIALEETATVVTGANGDHPTDDHRHEIDATPVSDDHADCTIARVMRTHDADAALTQSDAPLPARLGSYILRRRLGAGAMGVVYLAEQSNPKRSVALKVVRPDVLTPDALRRFQLEAHTLGRLKHPGIAAIFEAGAAEGDGRPTPYFAMEYVEGEPLDAHAAGRSVHDIAALVIDAAEAVEHAHRRGIIHRDLKPANIMVDADGQVKVLDFGVARAISDANASAAEFAGTAPYMSPEQLDAAPDVDTRSDIYALGVILYELLAGVRPHRFDKSSTIDEFSRLVREGDIAPPSAHADRIDRDVDAVVMRALAIDRDERYRTAGDLAADLTRWLRREPVSARPRTAPYVALRFSQRNPGFVAGAAATALALAAGVIGVSVFAVEAARGRALARTEAARAAAVNTFLTDMLASVDPENALGADLTVREVLDEAARDAHRRLADAPTVESAVRITLAHTYRGLGLLDESRRDAERALALSRDAFGDDDGRTADALHALGMTLVELGDFDRASDTFAEALAIREAEHGEESAEAALMRGERARVLFEIGRQQQAMQQWSAARERVAAELGERDPKTLTLMHNHAAALTAMGRFDQAERLFERVIRLREDVFGAEHPQTLTGRSMLAGLMQKQDRNIEAAEQFRLVVDGRERVLGHHHHSTITAKANLAAALIRLAEFARLDGDAVRAREALTEAESLTRHAVEGYTTLLGTDHPKTVTALGNLAYVYEEQGNDAAAEIAYREIVEERLDDESRAIEAWGPRNNLAMLLCRTGRVDEAVRIYETLLDQCDATLPEDHYLTAIFRNNYGACLIERGDTAAARAALDDSHAVLSATFGEGHPRVVKSNDRRAQVRSIAERSRKSE